MKIMISFLSLAVIVAGILPIFNIPWLKGAGFPIMIGILAIILLASAFMNPLLIGSERFFLVLQSILLIFLVVLQFIPSLLAVIPREGFVYSLLIMAVGAIGLIYGLVGMG